MKKWLCLLVAITMMLAALPASAGTLSDDGATLTVMLMGWSSDYLSSPDELVSVQLMEESTGVHIDRITASATESVEKYATMLASPDSWPDIITNSLTYYPGGLELAVEEGFLLDLTDIIPEYMPNYQAMRTSTPEIAKGTISDDGRMLSIYRLKGDLEGPVAEPKWAGLLIRQDWLDQLGLEVPVTIADWEEVLTGFKAFTDKPLAIGADGMFDWGPFLTAFGVLPEFMQVDGKVTFGPLEPGFKSYVELMRDWYAKGLIDPDFMGGDIRYGYYYPYGDIVSNNVGACASSWGWSANALYNAYGATDNPDFYLTGVHNPVLNEGDQPQTGYPHYVVSDTDVAITTACEDVELAARWLDYLFTEEAMIFNSFGKEGLTYNIVDGEYVYTDLITHNPDGLSPSLAAGYYTLHNQWFGWYNWARVEQMHNPAVRDAVWVWNEDSIDYVIPTAVSRTAEEGDRYNAKYTDINTMVEESVVAFITGAKDMSEWDAFIQSLQDAGIQECIDIWQAALDRYNARI